MKVFYLILLPAFLWSQDTSIKEQLLNAIDTSQLSIDKTHLYLDLAWEYVLENNDSTLIYAAKALEDAQLLEYAYGQVLALETKGLFYEKSKGALNLASQFYFDAIALCEQNNIDYIYSIYHSMGVMFLTSDKMDKAQEYLNIAYEGALDQKDNELQKYCLINLGAAYSGLEKFDEAIHYMQKSILLKIRKDLDYVTYANIGNLYCKKDSFLKALPFLEKAIEINPENTQSETNVQLYLYAKVKLKDTTEIHSVLGRAIHTLETIKEPREQSLFAMSLADYYTLIGDYKSALDYRNQHLAAFEHLKENQRDDLVYDLEKKYQTEKKDQELERNAATQQLLFWILFLVALSLCLITFFLIKNRRKNKILDQQKQLLQQTLDEKNVLLKEVHHRVKNNLQLVASLLNLQSRFEQDESVLQAINKGKNRVQTISVLHQNLYVNEDLKQIKIKKYFTELAHGLAQNHIVNDQPIELIVEIDDIHLDIQQVIPLGLIINELMTNALKYAFDGIQTKGRLTLSIQQEKQAITLKVADNGIGLPFSEIPVPVTSLGMQLIQSFSKKLNAELSIDNTNGSVFVLKFKGTANSI